MWFQGRGYFFFQAKNIIYDEDPNAWYKFTPVSFVNDRYILGERSDSEQRFWSRSGPLRKSISWPNWAKFLGSRLFHSLPTCKECLLELPWPQKKILHVVREIGGSECDSMDWIFEQNFQNSSDSYPNALLVRRNPLLVRWYGLASLFFNGELVQLVPIAVGM